MTCYPDYQCQGNCSGRGECDKGVCICSAGYTGPKCDLQPMPANVTVNPHTPQVSITPTGLDVEFRISIIELREVTVQGSVVQKVILDSLNFSVTAGNSSWNYHAGMEIGGTLQIEFSTASEPRNITFANQTFVVGANALKFSVGVTVWPFQALQNKLIIVTKAEAIIPQTACNVPPEPTLKPVNDSLVWTSSEYLGVTLFGRFLQNALLDGEPAPSKTTYDTLAGEYLITLPHFWDVAIVDPDFSILMNPEKPPSTGSTITTGCNLVQESPGNNFATPVIATLVAVFGAAGLIMGFLLLRRRRQNKRTLKRLRGNKDEEKPEKTTKATALLAKATRVFSPKSHIGNSPLYKDNHTSFNPLYTEN